MTEPTSTTPDAEDAEALADEQTKRRGPTAAARPEPGGAVATVDPASFVEVAEPVAEEVAGGDPLAGLRRPTGGTVTDRARRAEAIEEAHPSGAGEVEVEGAE